jgi:hypothetical protein
MLTVNELLEYGVIKDSQIKRTSFKLSNKVNVVKVCPKCLEDVDIHPIDDPFFSTESTIAIQCGSCKTKYAICIYCGKYVRNPQAALCTCEIRDSFIKDIIASKEQPGSDDDIVSDIEKPRRGRKRLDGTV